MQNRRRGRILAAWILFLLSPAAANSQFSIDNARLVLDGRPFVVRGVAYGNVPIGASWADTMAASECLYARDLPLIAGAGANTVRTLSLVPAGSRAFSQALVSNKLYWLAGFPLDRFFDPRRSLSAETAQGAELRTEILDAFRAYVEAWKDEPRLLAFAFGNEVDLDYGRKFAGSPADFYSLLREAAAVIKDVTPGRLITTSVADVRQIGAFNLGTNDPNQPALSFWSISAAGRPVLNALIQEARIRTAKPFLFSSFGADPYDDATQSETAGTQASATRLLARELTLAAANPSFAVLGGVWTALLDEWWRGGPDATRHGIAAVESDGGALFHPAWSGLFGVERGSIEGLDNLRPREAYFALAQEWGGTPPPGLAIDGPPAIDLDGVRNAASGDNVIAPGSLFAAHGERFNAGGHAAATAADLSYQLGDISLCVDGRAAPTYFADEHEIRAQAPWETPMGEVQAIVYRAGVPSQPAAARVAAQAPGIFDGAVLQPGLPCPVNGENGVAPGAYLEIYGTGLGEVSSAVVTGMAASEAAWVSTPPKTSLDGRDLEVLYAGLLVGSAGVYQTNVRIPSDLAPGVAQLRLSANGSTSNAVPIQITSQSDLLYLSLAAADPQSFWVQAGGPPRQASIAILGHNGFCGLVRFELNGLPAGVKASIPIGFPGQTVPLRIWAEPGAPRARDAAIVVRAISSLPDAPSQTVRVTVLPALGDIRFRVVSGGWLSGAPAAGFEIDGQTIYQTSGGGPGRGFNFLTIDPQTGTIDPQSAATPPGGAVNPATVAVRNFDTWSSDQAVAAMEAYLQSLPAGQVVFAAIADDGGLLLTEETRRILKKTLGARFIDALEYQYSWAIITRVGASQPIAEGLLSDAPVIVERTLTFPMP